MLKIFQLKKATIGLASIALLSFSLLTWASLFPATTEVVHPTTTHELILDLQYIYIDPKTGEPTAQYKLDESSIPSDATTQEREDDKAICQTYPKKCKLLTKIGVPTHVL